MPDKAIASAEWREKMEVIVAEIKAVRDKYEQELKSSSALNANELEERYELIRKIDEIITDAGHLVTFIPDASE